ncbi:hypothetical protein JW756_02195 [Candidatus Woesearchaeota archaeon]|nr:hypothetical protein [Candidatus Woesearchaeota archaeon]
MIINKKGDFETSKLVGLVLALVVLGAIVFWIIPMISQSATKAKLEECKRTYDFDNDGLLGDDKCPCEYSSNQDTGYYLLKGTPNCIIKPKDPANPEKYVLADDLSGDEDYCTKSYSNLLKSDQKITEACNDFNELKDISKICAQAVCQKAKPDDKDCMSMCTKKDSECNKMLVEACKQNSANVKLS